MTDDCRKKTVQDGAAEDSFDVDEADPNSVSHSLPPCFCSCPETEFSRTSLLDLFYSPLLFGTNSPSTTQLNNTN